MRFELNEPGLEGNWVEIDDRWTRSEYEQMLEAKGKDFLKWMKKKILACHIVCIDGSTIENVDELVETADDRIDMRVDGWLGGVMPTAVAELRRLGNALVRPPSRSNEVTAPSHQAK